MNARVLKIVACTAVASLGLLLLPTLDAPITPIAQAAETVAALVDQGAHGAVGCASGGQTDLLLGQLGSCPLDLIAPIFSISPLLPTTLVGVGDAASGRDSDGVPAEADSHTGADRAR